MTLDYEDIPFGENVEPDVEVCPRCDSDAVVTIAPETSPHYASARCQCGRFWWLPKPTTPPDRAARSKNRALLDDWREILGGTLICFHCQVSETDYKGPGFDAHHGVDISNDGDHRLIIPYCHDCHKDAERKKLYRTHVT